MIVLDCGYDPPHTHEFPDDWDMGPNGNCPIFDARWKPTTYIYMDDTLHIIHTTHVPLCDDEAIDRFTQVANYGPGFNPKWIQVKRPDKSTETLQCHYNPDTDEVHEGL